MTQYKETGNYRSSMPNIKCTHSSVPLGAPGHNDGNVVTQSPLLVPPCSPILPCFAIRATLPPDHFAIDFSSGASWLVPLNDDEYFGADVVVPLAVGTPTMGLVLFAHYANRRSK